MPWTATARQRFVGVGTLQARHLCWTVQKTCAAESWASNPVSSAAALSAMPAEFVSV